MAQKAVGSSPIIRPKNNYVERLFRKSFCFSQMLCCSYAFFRDLPPGDKPTPVSEQRRFDLPYRYLEDAQQYSTEKAVKDCTKPKLFIAGAYDTQTPLEQVKQTFAVAAEPKQFIEVPSYHGYRYSKVGIAEINKLIGKFVTEQL